MAGPRGFGYMKLLCYKIKMNKTMIMIMITVIISRITLLWCRGSPRSTVSDIPLHTQTPSLPKEASPKLCKTPCNKTSAQTCSKTPQTLTAASKAGVFNPTKHVRTHTTKEDPPGEFLPLELQVPEYCRRLNPSPLELGFGVYY